MPRKPYIWIVELRKPDGTGPWKPMRRGGTFTSRREAARTARCYYHARVQRYVREGLDGDSTEGAT